MSKNTIHLKPSKVAMEGGTLCFAWCSRKSLSKKEEIWKREHKRAWRATETESCPAGACVPLFVAFLWLWLFLYTLASWASDGKAVRQLNCMAQKHTNGKTDSAGYCTLHVWVCILCMTMEEAFICQCRPRMVQFVGGYCYSVCTTTE